MSPVLLVALSYVLGSTPTSYWLGRLVYDKDLTEIGSGNLGATNTFRAFGWPAALLVLAVDVAKGWFPAWYFPQVDGTDVVGWALVYGGMSVIGHVFSFWVRFRGGKGVATSAGVLTAVAPLPMGAAVAAWGLVAGTTRIVSLASLTAALAVPLAAEVVGPPMTAPLRGFLWGMACFVFWAHRSNIQRILIGAEPRIGAARRRGTTDPAEPKG